MAESTLDRGPMAALSRLVFRVLLPVTAVLVILYGIAYTSDIPVTDLLRDPSATLEGPWYTGLISLAGIALWAAAAAICMICLSAGPTLGERSLLFAGAVSSVILGADDAFLGHEAIKNIIGIPSPVTIAIYGIITLAVFWRAWPYLKTRPDLLVFIAAVALFLLSALLDAAGEADLPTPPYSAVIEDTAKFLGLVTWVTFFSWVGKDVIQKPS